jgi:branched-chain amino acid aminotransferase
VVSQQWASHLLLDGEGLEFGSGKIHLSAETVLRGVNVFEGIRAYRGPGDDYSCIPGLDLHGRRLFDSARLLRIPDPGFSESVPRLCRQLVSMVDIPAGDWDLYIRPTLFLRTGAMTLSRSEISVGNVVLGRWIPSSSEPASVHCCSSTITREELNFGGVLAKAGANYTGIRLARLQAMDQGADEALILTREKLIVETGGANVFVVKQGFLSTPPVSDGALNGVTRYIVLRLASRVLGLPTEIRSVHRDEAYAADEVFLTGTQNEVSHVSRLDHIDYASHSDSITGRLYRLYIAYCNSLSESSGPTANSIDSFCDSIC